MAVEFNLFFYILVLAALFFAVYGIRRALRQEPLFYEQDYWLDREGYLHTPHVLLAPHSTQITFKDGSQAPIELAQVRGIYLNSRGSRRIGIGVLLPNNRFREISYITNNEMNRAAANAELLAEVLAGEGKGFLQAFAASNWGEILRGIPFEYPFHRGEGQA